MSKKTIHHELPAGWAVDVAADGTIRQCWRSFVGPGRNVHSHRYELADALGLGMLHDIRSALGIGQADVAEAVDVTAPAVALWDRGESAPRGLYQKAFATWLCGLPNHGKGIWTSPESRAALSGLAVALDTSAEQVQQMLLRTVDGFDEEALAEAWQDPRLARAYAITLKAILWAERYTSEQVGRRHTDTECAGDKCNE